MPEYLRDWLILVIGGVLVAAAFGAYLYAGPAPNQRLAFLASLSLVFLLRLAYGRWRSRR